MQAADDRLLAWCLWVGLAHHPRDVRGAVDSRRIIGADVLLDRWHRSVANDAAIQADVERAFSAPAHTQSVCPPGLRIEIRPLPIGLAAGWDWSYQAGADGWQQASLVVEGAAALVAAIRRLLLDADDSPAVPVRPALAGVSAATTAPIGAVVLPARPRLAVPAALAGGRTRPAPSQTPRQLSMFDIPGGDRA